MFSSSRLLFLSFILCSLSFIHSQSSTGVSSPSSSSTGSKGNSTGGDTLIPCGVAYESDRWQAPNVTVKTSYCRLYSDTKVFPVGTRLTYRRLDRVQWPICVVVGPPEGSMYIQTFWPTVDEFSLLQVARSFGWNSLDGTVATRIQLEIGGQMPQHISLPKLRKKYTSKPTCAIVNFWTAIIELDNGEVKDIAWDDDCSLCDDDHCVDGQCGVDQDSCDASCLSSDPAIRCTNPLGKTNCDLKIYIGWKGTDRDGNYLTSYSRRLSNFRVWSLSAAYDSASKFADDQIPSAIGGGDLPTQPPTSDR